MLVMVVDDERDMRESLEEILSAAGYEVVTASSGEEALEYLEERRVDMMLVDFSMPGMSGEELLIELERDSRRPPAMVITALAPWRMIELIQRGVGYLRKPINTALLLNVVETFMRKDPGHAIERIC